MKKLFTLLTLAALFSPSAFGQWVNIDLPSISDYEALHFFDDNTGVVAGVESIVRTTDGGVNWQSVNSDDFDFKDIHFINNNTGFAVGFANFGQLLVYKTTDGGVTWTSDSVGGNGNINAITFATPNNGFMVGNSNVLYSTTDGGANWSTSSLPTGGLTSPGFHAFHFLDAQTGFLVGGMGTEPGLILKTTDGGVNWTEATVNGSTEMLRDVHFPSPMVGYAVGWYYNVLKTTDGGNTWNALTTNNDILICDAVYFFDDLTGYIAGAGATNPKAPIIKTTDGGQTWTPQLTDNNTHVWQIQFLNANVGYATGGNLGSIYKLDLGTSVQELEEASSFEVFPNPFRESLTLDLSGIKSPVRSLEVVDITGRTVFQTRQNINSLDLSQLSSGLYTLVVSTDDQQYSKKVVKH